MSDEALKVDPGVPAPNDDVVAEQEVPADDVATGGDGRADAAEPLTADVLVAEALASEPSESLPREQSEVSPDEHVEIIADEQSEPSTNEPPGSVTEEQLDALVTGESRATTADGKSEAPPSEESSGSEPSEAAGPQAAPDQPTPMSADELKSVVEALIFASPDPITPKTLYKLLANESKDAVSDAVNTLRADYLNRPGLTLVEVAGGYQIVTRPELHEWVRRLFHERSTQKLSVAALETLAVIAYRQPVTALEITDIRGVNTSGVLSTLLERNLIKIVGRKNVVGRPFMYGTTKEFLIRFGLKDLGDLPKIEDMADALGFNPPAGLIEQTPREEVLPLDETEEGAPPTADSGDSTDPVAS